MNKKLYIIFFNISQIFVSSKKSVIAIAVTYLD